MTPVPRLSALCAVVAVFLGCAASETVRFAPADYCPQPVDPAMARVVFTRTKAFVGGGALFRLMDNGQPIGDVKNGDKICWDRFPGRALIRGFRVFPKFEPLSFSDAQLVIDVEAGRVYYVQGSFDGTWETAPIPK